MYKANKREVVNTLLLIAVLVMIGILMISRSDSSWECARAEKIYNVECVVKIDFYNFPLQFQSWIVEGVDNHLTLLEAWRQ